MRREGKPERVVGGRYRLIEELGTGGFGRVWRARDEMLSVEVAVKEVRPESASKAERAERLKRAEREARNAARLRDHPNVVPVHDVIVEGGSPWIVMRMVDGASLAERIHAEGRLPVDRVRDIAIGLLRALGAAEQAGITHRDVTPANVLLTDDGEVLLTDFGIAVHVADARLTDHGILVGNIEYAAPERWKEDDQGTASDLFSLGATLYAAVEGKSPFQRDTHAASMAAIVVEQNPTPEHAGTLTALIIGLLAKDPDQRPTIAEALAMANPPTPARDPRTRRLISDRSAPPEYQCTRVLNGHEGWPAPFAMAFSPDGRLLATGNDDGTARLWNLATGQPTGAPLTGHGYVWAVAFSPDGRLLATGNDDGTARLWNPATGQPTGAPLTGHAGYVVQVTFSPDGRRLATGSYDGTVRLWDSESGKPIGNPLIGPTHGALQAVAFSPSGRLIASSWNDETMHLWNPETGEPIGRPLTGHTSTVYAVAFSPDGHMLATGTSDGTVRLWNPATGEPIGHPLTDQTQPVTAAAFSPDGGLLTTGSSNGTVWLWNPATGERVGQALAGHDGSVRAVAFSPDGRVFATGGYDKIIRLWSRIHRNGQGL